MKLFQKFENNMDLRYVEKNLGKINEIFIEMGEELSDVKERKLYKKYGYNSFKTFIDIEFNMSMNIINKILRVYRTMVCELDFDEESLKEIGFDKLVQVVSVKKMVENLEEFNSLIDYAKSTSLTKLREKILEIKEDYKKII
ncbi:MAG: hypothetical protein OMM_06929 [Candidatus Magnetoglobus multicellularis str. Araruama]|uniref:Uncharacterized protein n=1 Tax=Candidatus Magnetoglobus multicellularis str. Araruama TaxID=890399 RepID=A0A1V1PF75_9BACT|nr:MAG: hypothetical protein OMM_06929 [Candidatus Magnetoglobus multicellularis str. Araruama]